MLGVRGGGEGPGEGAGKHLHGLWKKIPRGNSCNLQATLHVMSTITLKLPLWTHQAMVTLEGKSHGLRLLLLGFTVFSFWHRVLHCSSWQPQIHYPSTSVLSAGMKACAIVPGLLWIFYVFSLIHTCLCFQLRAQAVVLWMLVIFSNSLVNFSSFCLSVDKHYFLCPRMPQRLIDFSEIFFEYHLFSHYVVPIVHSSGF